MEVWTLFSADIYRKPVKHCGMFWDHLYKLIGMQFAKCTVFVVGRRDAAMSSAGSRTL